MLLRGSLGADALRRGRCRGCGWRKITHLQLGTRCVGRALANESPEAKLLRALEAVPAVPRRVARRRDLRSPASARGVPSGRATQDPERARWERFLEFERREREEEARMASGGGGGGSEPPGLPPLDDDDDDSAGGNGSVTSLSEDDGTRRGVSLV